MDVLTETAKRVEFFYVEAGGGHKSAAIALKAVIDGQGRPWDVKLTNLNLLLSPTDHVKTVTGRGIEDWYNFMLKKGWTIGAAPAIPPMHFLIWLFRGPITSMLVEHFRQWQPDLVVSLIPHFNRYLNRAVREVSAQTPFVTVITDFADIPPRVWLERQQQYVVCGTDKAVRQAREQFGHAADRVFRVSGMILRPSFYDLTPIDREAERARLGLQPGLPTALVLFGGEGARPMIDIARRLSDSGLALQLILMYGRNEELGAELRALKLRIPAHIQGFTNDVPRFMQMADFMLGKPGPGSISEALALRLPIVVDLNAWTMPQERYNAEWLVENQLGLVVKNWREVVGAVGQMLAPGALEAYRARAAGLNNRAVFEIADLLERVMERGP